jgi:hypothetical protein
MNFSDDDLRKIGVVNRFIVHSERTIDRFTDADKTYFLELYGRLSRCSGQDTIDKLAAKSIDDLKIKGRDGNRCIMVKPKTKNAFTDELKTIGFRLVGQRAPVRGRPTQRVRPVAAPSARRTSRVRSSRVASPIAPARPQISLGQILSSDTSEVVPVVAPQQIVRDEEDLLFRRDSAFQRELASRRVAPVVAPVAAPVVPPISNERIIEIVRDTVQETIRDFISASTPVAGGRRKTRRHRRHHY